MIARDSLCYVTACVRNCELIPQDSFVQSGGASLRGWVTTNSWRIPDAWEFHLKVLDFQGLLSKFQFKAGYCEMLDPALPGFSCESHSNMLDLLACSCATHLKTRDCPGLGGIGEMCGGTLSGVAPAKETKERSVHELFARAFRNKSSMWIVLVFLRKNTRIHKKGEIHELFVLALSLVWFAGATPDFGEFGKGELIVWELKLCLCTLTSIFAYSLFCSGPFVSSDAFSLQVGQWFEQISSVVGRILPNVSKQAACLDMAPPHQKVIPRSRVFHAIIKRAPLLLKWEEGSVHCHMISYAWRPKPHRPPYRK